MRDFACLASLRGGLDSMSEASVVAARLRKVSSAVASNDAHHASGVGDQREDSTHAQSVLQCTT